MDAKSPNSVASKPDLSQKGREDSPAPMNFQEISRKPVTVERKTLNENKPFLRDRSASIGTINQKTPIAHLIGEQNRTMLFQVGRSELRLISPDRKQILLHRAFKDVASCVLGRLNKEHFGFVCRETNDTYACYVFKCESDSVALELINAIKQAFVAHADLLKKSREKSPNMTCEHCPMLWYHRLCHDIEGMNDKKTHAFILRRIEQLPEDEQDLIITKYQGGTNHMYETAEHNAFLMMLLRAHCEAKQTRHVHDTAENRSEFLNQYLGGSTIFSKARRSISSSFDLLKRKASRDDGTPPVIKKDTSPLPTPVPIVMDSGSEHNQDLLSPEVVRSKSLSPAVIDGELTVLRKPSGPKGKRTREELRQLWKMAIDQTILLVRMEKENARLKESEESSAVRRIKLEYNELSVCDGGVSSMWDSLLSRDSSQPMAKVDRHMLTQAVIQGRTFPKHSYFASALGPGQLALYNILKAYSLLDPDVGYCQGLSFVAGVLLLHEAMDAITNYQKNQSKLEATNKALEQQLTLLSRYISAHHKQEIPLEIKKIVQNHSKKLTFKIFSTKFSNDEQEDPRKNFKTGLSSPNLFSKIREDSPKDIEHERRQFAMKKSQSVHSGLIANMKNYQLKVLDEKAETKQENITDTLKELGKKNAGFFASTHEQIRQERLFEHQLKNNFDENLRKLDEKLNEKLNPSSYIDDLSIFQSRKSMSLNLTPINDGKVNDSGFVTPLSPDEKKEDSSSTISHPLSDCDVEIKFDGQSTKLKQIRPIKHVEKS
ncbi:hypothetical protein HF086_011137 [Spodoptera exigua]|uniref:PID domain-containing protein n=1 Tax=Spodoptera exigua TaxID=7107 RepID=A0A922MYX6_SPOEX|nr:hypothetical protein HF086_011137 [Spodoptera exigua]